MSSKEVIDRGEDMEESWEWLDRGLDIHHHSIIPLGNAQSGYINRGISFSTLKHGDIFVKFNEKNHARDMFKGERTSLETLHRTGTVKVPLPIQVVCHDSGGAALVMRHLRMRPLSVEGETKLGQQLAQMHLNNPRKLQRRPLSVDLLAAEADSGQDHFGFPVPTSCGYFLQDNSFVKEWQAFITRKMDQAITTFVKRTSNVEFAKLWLEAEQNIEGLFASLKGPIYPSLLHGDLWRLNAAELDQEGSAVPVIFDPSSFYGHHEFDLAASTIIGSPFGAAFHEAYHSLIPKERGFLQRQSLYKLFYFFNQHNHLDGGYRDSSSPPPLLSFEVGLNLLRELSASDAA
ncbi:Ketosamine-3-kinase [Hypsibius exemplaris]|uniref:protein-ribulosamine 3-kinase n=1 Tax=Hypsibius exemplaris TaxID=2072580 RepID=A0A1W0X8J0_HYPEX|nr:Ketosamine-3-kinase [Hypsibius exemplaris]